MGGTKMEEMQWNFKYAGNNHSGRTTHWTTWRITMYKCRHHRSWEEQSFYYQLTMCICSVIKDITAEGESIQRMVCLYCAKHLRTDCQTDIQSYIQLCPRSEHHRKCEVSWSGECQSEGKLHIRTKKVSAVKFSLFEIACHYWGHLQTIMSKEVAGAHTYIGRFSSYFGGGEYLPVACVELGKEAENRVRNAYMILNNLNKWPQEKSKCNIHNDTSPFSCSLFTLSVTAVNNKHWHSLAAFHCHIMHHSSHLWLGCGNKSSQQCKTQWKKRVIPFGVSSNERLTCP